MKLSISKFLIAGLIALLAGSVQAQNGPSTIQFTVTDQYGATRPSSYVTFTQDDAQGPSNQIYQPTGSGYGTVQIPGGQSYMMRAQSTGCGPDIQRTDRLQIGATYSFQFVLRC